MSCILCSQTIEYIRASCCRNFCLRFLVFGTESLKGAWQTRLNNSAPLRLLQVRLTNNHHSSTLIGFGCIFCRTLSYNSHWAAALEKWESEWHRPCVFAPLSPARRHLLCTLFAALRSYLGVTPPISTNGPTDEEVKATETLMEELRRQNVFESEEEARTRYVAWLVTLGTLSSRGQYEDCSRIVEDITVCNNCFPV